MADKHPKKNRHKKHPRGWASSPQDLNPEDRQGCSRRAKAAREDSAKKLLVLEDLCAAIVALGQPSNALAIHEYCIETWGHDNIKAVRNLLKENTGGALQASAGQRFWVSGVEVPAAPVEPAVEIEEQREGEGDPVETGDAVLINYSLALATRPDAAVDKGKGFDFTVGSGDVIKGMDEGVKGLKLGGKRVIQVPWSLGYGKKGSSYHT